VPVSACLHRTAFFCFPASLCCLSACACLHLLAAYYLPSQDTYPWLLTLYHLPTFAYNHLYIYIYRLLNLSLLTYIYWDTCSS
jgi:hypothetical protein